LHAETIHARPFYVKSVLIPLLEQPDLDALRNCLLFLSKNGTETLMIVLNPNVGITDANVTLEIDKRIADLKAAIKERKEVDDFAAAQSYKEELESAQVDRDLAIRDGWANIPEPDRRKIYQKALGNIGTDAIFPLRENYSYAEFYRALHELQSQWPKDMPQGEYAIVWPRSVSPQEQPVAASMAEVSASSLQSQKPLTLKPSNPAQERRSALKRHFALVSAKKKHGIPEETPKDTAIDQIIRLEFPEAA